jgi:hypothetical protein
MGILLDRALFRRFDDSRTGYANLELADETFREHLAGHELSRKQISKTGANLKD